ncbi:MAG: hypothetical protein ACF8MF_06755 [Phycisphaerales bacterium JB052]
MKTIPRMSSRLMRALISAWLTLMGLLIVHSAPLTAFAESGPSVEEETAATEDIAAPPDTLCLAFELKPPCLLITVDALNTLDSGYRLERDRRIAAELALERHQRLNASSSAPAVGHAFAVGVGSTCFVLGAVLMFFVMK